MELIVYMVAGAALPVLAWVVHIMWLTARNRTTPQNDLLAMLDSMQRQQSELTGQLSQLTQTQETTRTAMTTQLTDVMKTVNDNLKEARDKTDKSLGTLGERLSLIDKAQKEITALSSQVVELQHILDNKQARGAFGEAQLADIVRDGLPESAYALQHTLSNGKRVDCVIRLPNPPGPIAIDSKFPMEAFQKWRAAEDENQEKAALKQLGTDMQTHAKTIAEKYILPGETADAALMFLPSESIFSELHLRLPQVVDKCRAMRVYPVSPNTMSLTLNTVRAIMRDVKMREQAHRIQSEVRLLLEDVGRLSERVSHLRSHFDRADKDIGLIETSTNKIHRRGETITNIDDAAETLPATGEKLIEN